MRRLGAALLVLSALYGCGAAVGAPPSTGATAHGDKDKGVLHSSTPATLSAAGIPHPMPKGPARDRTAGHHGADTRGGTP